MTSEKRRMQSMVQTPKEIFRTFKTILHETAQTFGIRPENVREERFLYVGDGRLSQHKYLIIDTFARLRDYAVFGAKGRPGRPKADHDAIRRILSATRKQQDAA